MLVALTVCREVPLRRTLSPSSPPAALPAGVLDLGLAFVALIWGLSPTLFKFVLAELDPLAFVFLRFSLLSALAICVLFWRGAHGGTAWRVRKRDVPLLIVSGLSGYGFYQLLYMEGLAHTTVFSSALLGATVPLWAAIQLAVLRIERIHAIQWLGILLSFCGVAWFLLAGGSHSSELASDRALTSAEMLLGDTLTIVAAGLFALYGVVNKRLTTRYSPPELMCYTLLIGTLALAPFGIPALLHQDWSRVTWHTWVILPYSVLFPIYLTYSIWNWAIGRRGVGYVTLYNYAVPILGGIFAWLVLGEALTPLQAAAGAIVLAGLLAARWGAMHVRAAAGDAGRAAPGASPASAPAIRPPVAEPRRGSVATPSASEAPGPAYSPRR